MSSDPTTAPFSSVRKDLRQTMSDISAMLNARRRLAELEIRHDIAASRQLLIVGGVAIVLVLVGLPVAVVAITLQLEELYSDSLHWPMLLVATFFILIGSVVLWSSWVRFRRDFLGLQESMAELREDLIWLRDWAESKESDRE